MTSKKDLLRLVALKNCEGASLLADEEFEDAIAKFTIAYHCIGQVMRNGDTDGEESDNDIDIDNIEGCIPPESVDKYHFILDSPEVAWYAASRTEPSAACPAGSNNSGKSDGNASSAAHIGRASLSSSSQNNHYVYNEAMVFHPDNATDPHSAPFFEAVILFNMAVTFHHACEQQRQQQQQLDNDDNGAIRTSGGGGTSPTTAAKWCHSHARALACYNQCLARLKEGNYSHTLNKANLIVEAHMLIATLNNKVQVLFSLGDYCETYWILREFFSVMEGTEGTPPGFQEAEIRGLEGTLELLNSPEISAVLQDVTTTTAVAGKADRSNGNSNNVALPGVSAAS